MERRANGSPTITAYEVPNTSQLDRFVNRLETTAPAKFIKPGVLEEKAAHIDVLPTLENLPPGITPEDFIGINKLSLYTECATDLYADAFTQASLQYDAPWLGRFTELWAEDEMSHHAPFKIILMQMGVEEDVLDAEVKRIQSLDYIHESGDTPAHLTAFGMLQELLTRNWYTQTKSVLKQASPEAASMVALVESREAAHTAWYRDMTAMQIEENPELIANVAESLKCFQLPGNILIPDIQQHASRWLPALHRGELEGLKKEIIRMTHHSLKGDNPEKDTKNLGRLMVELGAQSDEWMERITMEQARRALDKFGNGAGYGLLGEGVLHSVGLDGLYEQSQDNIPGKIRGVFRDFVAGRVADMLDNKFGFAPPKELTPSQPHILNSDS